MTPIRWACPSCRGALVAGEGGLRCAPEGLDFPDEGGIHRMLPPERAVRYADFLRDYREVRRREGRAASDPAWLRGLPSSGTAGPHRREWQVRAAGLAALLDAVVEPLERRRRRLRVADVGAGNGWLAHRLAERGHRVLAVDINDDDGDGLGAHRHYGGAFTSVQAEFEHLPVAAAELDLVIFNGALHYAPDVARPLAEAVRVAAAGAVVVVMDSPVYRRSSSGEAMVRERRQRFTERFGFPSDALPAEEFLTRDRAAEVGREVGLHWHWRWPWVDLRWAVGPLAARLRGRREPARFPLLWAEVA